MNRFIILLRGVTPTGKGRVPMADFRDGLTKAGFSNPRTWIQSGNAVVDTGIDRQATAETASRVLAEMGAQLAVIVKTAEEIAAVLSGNPFSELPLERVFFGLFNEAPDGSKAKVLMETGFGEDRLAITKEAVYCFIPGSAARTKLNNVWLQKKLGVDLTFRNANTLLKLVEMAGEA